jgi:hypothetical protein
MMAKQLTPVFDYSAMAPDSKGKLIWYAAEINRQAATHVEAGLEMGRLLSEARELVGESKFKEWVRRECGHAVSSAYRYISAYENFGASPNLRLIELSAMYVLAKNEDAKKRAFKLANKGTRITHDIAKQLVADAKEDVIEPDEESEEIIDVETEVSTESEPEIVVDSESVPATVKQSLMVETPTDYGICPNCKGKKWTADEFGATCAKCSHPHGEPLGDVDDDVLKTLLSKTVKTVEALMRCGDDVHSVKPVDWHAEFMAMCKRQLALVRGGK